MLLYLLCEENVYCLDIEEKKTSKIRRKKTCNIFGDITEDFF